MLADLPNPGGDLTYPLQFASGALINTAGSSSDAVGGNNGYGNVEFNGLPAASNGYIVDGLETNDPLTNLNIGLATNLVLGMNSISEVTVNTLSYSVDQGRYGASQVSYVTKSGTNNFHGNLYEIWNGSALNAADYFTNATPGNQKPGSIVNHFGAQPRRPTRARQTLHLFGFRMGPPGASHRHTRHGSDPGLRELCFAATAFGRHRLRDRHKLPGRAAGCLCSVAKTCFLCSGTPPARRSPFSGVRFQPRRRRGNRSLP